MPVRVEMTSVASVMRPETTARDEARTVMGEDGSDGGDEERGVLDPEPVAWGAIVGCVGREA